MKELLIGAEFDRLSIWYYVIDEVLSVEGSLALAACHAEDGFKLWYIFEKVDGLWKSSYSSTVKDAMEDQFKMMVNNRR